MSDFTIARIAIAYRATMRIIGWFGRRDIPFGRDEMASVFAPPAGYRTNTWWFAQAIVESDNPIVEFDNMTWDGRMALTAILPWLQFVSTCRLMVAEAENSHGSICLHLHFHFVFDLFLFYFAISIPPLSLELSKAGMQGRLPYAGEPRP